MSTQFLTLEQVCKELTLRSTPLPANPSSRFHIVLRYLATTLTRAYTLDELLRSLAVLTMQAMEIDLCVVMLKKQRDDDLWVCACAPELEDTDVVLRPVTVVPAMWKRLQAFLLHGSLPRSGGQEFEVLNPLANVQYHALLPIPLIAGSEYLGLLNCYARKLPEYSGEEQLLISTIANQAALAIAYRLHLEEDLQTHKTMVNAFVHDLCTVSPDMEPALSRRAALLGYNLAHPHLVIQMGLCTDYGPPGRGSQGERYALFADVVEQFRLHLQECYPGSLVDERANICTCLLCLEHISPDEQPDAWLKSFIDRTRCERQCTLVAGISDPCSHLSEYPRGYAEANEALKLGQCLHQEGGSHSFSTLGVYRYIYQFAHDNRLSDQYQEQVASIVEYDQRKRTRLLSTLENYLECGGNIARTSCQLTIHRNTLLQRLERLQKLCVLDLEQVQNRLPLLVAIKLHRLYTHDG